MNIFILSIIPKDAAEAHGDKHVVKMILEACQMLYTAHWTAVYPELLKERSAVKIARLHKGLAIPAHMRSAPNRKAVAEAGFRPVHLHHPCTIWVRECLGNYMWTVELALALAECCHRERQRIGSAGPGGAVRVRIWGKFRGKSLPNLRVSCLFRAISCDLPP